MNNLAFYVAILESYRCFFVILQIIYRSKQLCRLTIIYCGMNKSQFKAQFDNLYLPLCMYSLKIVGIREEAEDIVQGCFTSVWERICNGDDIENIRAYMYGAVRNMSLTFLKRSSKIDELESGSEYGESVSADDIDTSERDARLWQAISDLPEKCRKVFLLSKKDGFSNAQIAEEMGISVKTVENQMTKAYSRLREALNPAGRKVFFLPFL